MNGTALSCPQLAQALNVSPMCVRRWVIEGKVQPTILTENGGLQFDLKEARRVVEVFKQGNELRASTVCEVLAIVDNKPTRERVKSLLSGICKDFQIRSIDGANELAPTINFYSPDLVIVDLADTQQRLQICEQLKHNPDTSSCICVMLVGQQDEDSEGIEEYVEYILEKPVKALDLESVFQLEDYLYPFLDAAEMEEPDNRVSDIEEINFDAASEPIVEKPKAKDPSAASNKIASYLDELYIPPPPTLFNDIRAAVPDLRKIAKLIEKDAGVTSKLLQVVNSAAFAIEVKIASVPHAAMMLGLDFVLNIVNGVLLRKISDRVDSAALETFWKDANRTGYIAAYIAKKLGFGMPDEAFTLGLFHNCGVPIILQKYANYFDVVESCYKDASGEISKVERELLKCSHAEVGFLVAKAWSLPTYIIDTIKFHHDLPKIKSLLEVKDEQVDENTKKITQYLVILKVAEHIAGLYSCLGKQEQDYEWQEIKSVIFAYSGLDQDGFTQIKVSAIEELQNID